MGTLSNQIARLREGSVLVIGDVMLDTFVYGDVVRVSPEAPIPVLSVRDEVSMPGGAANVALNAAAIGVSATVIGLVGNDDAGRRLFELIGSAPYPAIADLVVDVGRPTTVKTRYVGNKQQILRSDRETTMAPSRAVEDQLIARVKARLPQAQIVAISDYAKGVLSDRLLTDIISSCQHDGVPVVIDPKRARWEIYRGAAVIKPNLRELAQATGLDYSDDESIAHAAQKMVAELNVQLLLTRSENGMSLYRAGYSPVHAQAATHEVFDVSGAGDTALAAFSSALAGGLDTVEAMRIANVASGVAVTKHGTAIVTAEELASVCANGAVNHPDDRIVTIDRAASICRQWKAHGLRVGFTNGCFDIVHSGHVAMLAQAASRCDRLIVALNSDNSVRRLKGEGRPVQPADSRAQVIAALEAASLVTTFDEDTPLELIKRLKPDLLFKGADYTKEQVVGGDLVGLWGGEVVLLKLVDGFSTTRAIRRARGLE
jgi:D-beta-D-heptose 7-phosphate kinase/D-beta-D-heptose 1-phosphate adenosyltransferase